jgi:hypothetical protein
MHRDGIKPQLLAGFQTYLLPSVGSIYGQLRRRVLAAIYQSVPNLDGQTFFTYLPSESDWPCQESFEFIQHRPYNNIIVSL